MIIGVDVGYGYTKAVAENGQRVVFPSVVGTGFERKMEKMIYEGSPSEADNYDLVVKNGDEKRRYFVGNLALLQSRDAVRPYMSERTSGEEIKPQLLTALGVLCQDEPAVLVTGLPLKSFFKQAKALKASLERLSGVEVEINGRPAGIWLERVVMFPQAVAALYGKLLKDKVGSSGAVGLVDVGFRTTDFVVFDLGSKKVLEEYNDTVTAGTNNIVLDIQKEIGEDAGATPNPERVEQAIRTGGPFHFNRKEYDIAALVAEKEEALGKLIASKVARKWSDIQEDLQVIYLAGGGAAAVQRALSKVAPCEVMEDCQFANAYGYLLKGIGKKDTGQTVLC